MPEAAPRSVSPAHSTQADKLKFIEQPSIKYPPIDGPQANVLKQAAQAPHPTLPRRTQRREWCSRARDKLPLSCGLTAGGRAGKYGELVGKDGGRYMGEVLAGRPHGRGQYFVPLGAGSTQYVLKYDGEWFQGLRQGQGTQYFASGEVYTGEFVRNARQGFGRLEYVNGDAYEGNWDGDRRNGRGLLLHADGNIFDGNFLLDRREGLGTLLRLSQGLKHVCEYVNDKPQCGSVLKINAPEIAPLTAAMRDTISQVKRSLPPGRARGYSHPEPLPTLELSQPSKVLAKQVVAARRARRLGGPRSRLAQESTGTFTDTQLEMLRHSYVLMAGGDGAAVGLLPAQLRELIVMADLSPSDPTNQALLGKLAGAHARFGDRRVHADDFLRIVSHFRRNVDADAMRSSNEELFPAARPGEGGENFPRGAIEGDEAEWPEPV